MIDHFGELLIIPNEEIGRGDVWMGCDPHGPPKRLLEAFARGKVTVGGMAEAGWRYVGKMVGDAKIAPH